MRFAMAETMLLCSKSRACYGGNRFVMANTTKRNLLGVISETATPHRMVAALTYARRYALFALVGIAGEDDLDAPDTSIEPVPINTQEDGSLGQRSNQKRTNGSVHKPRQTKPLLAQDPSATLREQLITEIGNLKSGDDLALWAHRRLPAKNTLVADDARAVEVAYQAVLDAVDRQSLPDESQRDDRDQAAQSPNAGGPKVQASSANGCALTDATEPPHHEPSTLEHVSPRRKTIRIREKAHLSFVAAQPCLVCQRSPCDAHHLKFAQPRSLGRKVSDEFTVPLCRDHHQQLHRHGDEIAWWANLRIAPLKMAEELWDATQAQLSAAARRKN